MLGIECLIKHGDQVLLQWQTSGAGPAHLGPIAAVPQHGESPIAACFRAVREQTSLKLSPSCAAVILEEVPGHSIDYRLAFVADLPGGLALPGGARLEWLPLPRLRDLADLPEWERQLLPQILNIGVPISAVIELDTSVDPAVQRLGEIAPIEPARLSPLVFATTN